MIPKEGREGGRKLEQGFVAAVFFFFTQWVALFFFFCQVELVNFYGITRIVLLPYVYYYYYLYYFEWGRKSKRVYLFIFLYFFYMKNKYIYIYIVLVSIFFGGGDFFCFFLVHLIS